MSSFYGSQIIFDSKSSLDFNLRISNFESGGTSDGVGGSEPTLFEKKIYRKSSPYYFGRSLHSPLTFNITLSNFDNEISAIDRNEIYKWLTGRNNYLPLSIVQDDMESITFNAFIMKSSTKFVGNVARGITIDVQCKEPWGLESEKTLSKSYSYGFLANETFNFYNSSAEDDYLYPYISIVSNNMTGDITIRNITDNNRDMAFTGIIYGGSTLSLDCSRQIISISTNLSLIDKFNKKFFRLIPGMNQIQIIGDVSSFAMTYQFARKIGG